MRRRLTDGLAEAYQLICLEQHSSHLYLPVQLAAIHTHNSFLWIRCQIPLPVLNYLTTSCISTFPAPLHNGQHDPRVCCLFGLFVAADSCTRLCVLHVCGCCVQVLYDNTHYCHKHVWGHIVIPARVFLCIAQHDDNLSLAVMLWGFIHIIDLDTGRALSRPAQWPLTVSRPKIPLPPESFSLQTTSIKTFPEPGNRI